MISLDCLEGDRHWERNICTPMVRLWQLQLTSKRTYCNFATACRMHSIEQSNHGRNLSFHQEWYGSTSLRVSQSFSTHRRTGIICLMDLATGQPLFTLANISKHWYSCFRLIFSMSQLSFKTFDVVPTQHLLSLKVEDVVPSKSWSQRFWFELSFIPTCTCFGFRFR